MKTLWCLALVLAAPLAGCRLPDDDEKTSQDLNVNSRYTVESVHFSGGEVKISSPLRLEVDKIVGTKYDLRAIEDLAERIKRESHVSDVKINVTRGTAPDHVIVNLDVKSEQQNFDLNVAKFVYDSKEGWNGDGAATLKYHGNDFTFGLVSDNDTLVERYAGLRAKFERENIFTHRLRFRFEFDSFHNQWNNATLAEAPADEIYRTRQVFTPEATLVIFQPLEWSFGVSFDRLGVPYSSISVGGAAAAKTESSNAVVNTLRYHRRWGSAHDKQEQEATAAYDVRAGTGLLDTDRVFTKHSAKASYRYRHGRSTVKTSFVAGHISGDAPLYERFVLGDSEMLRGWSRFDLDPLGGSHVLYGSVDYQYSVFQAFYDTGAVWDTPQQRTQRQSVGVGFKKECFQLAVAFPVSSGRADPIFYAGMNF
jgi:outer membrane protein assembly factor BamA